MKYYFMPIGESVFSGSAVTARNRKDQSTLGPESISLIVTSDLIVVVYFESKGRYRAHYGSLYQRVLESSGAGEGTWVVSVHIPMHD